MVQRGEHAAVPPYEDLVLEAGDLVIVAATRQALADLAKGAPELLNPELMADASHGSDGDSDDTGRRAARAGSGQVLAEVMVRPGSEMAGRTLAAVACRHKPQCIVLGIERHRRMLRHGLPSMQHGPRYCKAKGV